MTTQPLFLMYQPADAERVGGIAAIVLAAVRFRTRTAPQWRASYAEIAKQAGLKRDAVIAALERLENDGELLVQSGSGTDRTKSYCIPADQSFQDVPTPAKPADQSFPDVPTAFPDVPTPAMGTSGNALLTKNKKERKKPPARDLAVRSPTAQHIAEAFRDALPTPIEANFLARIAVEIDKCLQSGIEPPKIAVGLKAWNASDSYSPTQIAQWVHKANNRAAHGAVNGGADGKAEEWDEFGRRRAALREAQRAEQQVLAAQHLSPEIEARKDSA